ncbi:MAG: FAD-binding protein [Bacteroidia bacterium]|nr:FAD-binding protein [Bacteroidia bacterium]
MPLSCQISLLPAEAADTARISQAAARALGISASRIRHCSVVRRSVDARGKAPKIVLKLEVWADEPPPPAAPFAPLLRDVSQAPEVHIAGSGPAGLFAALRLIELGLKPVIIERGKAVRDRRRDLARLTREGIVHPDSNYCFGEGGAGTFSDGKLYTRATKRGDVRRILDLLHYFGAADDILIDAHPHIGTNKLPGIIEAIRSQIRACGGAIHFGHRLSGLEMQGGQLRGLVLQDGLRVQAQALILATGHSARDIFELLHRQGIRIEAKPFALGVRVEHPQALIDQIQYHCAGTRDEALPAAAYSLVHQAEGRGVYSFCMCPGGIICPAATAEGEVVVNGWSPSRRNSPYANSGMVVQLELSDFPGAADDPLAGLRFQQRIEQAACEAGGGQQQAPALRLTDFAAGRLSADLPACSYIPGVVPADLRAVLPDFIHRRLQQGFRQFGKQLRGYLTHEALVVATESRTSSPVRIPRDPETLMHPGLAGLYPCGEGAGYAGGIMSAAIDGERCAEAAAAAVLAPSRLP